MKRIAIHSVPRSGSTWLGQIVNSSPDVIYKYQPLFSYAFKDRLNSESSREEILQFFAEIAATEDDFLDQRSEIEKGHCPEFVKSPTPDICAYKEVRYHHILRNLMDQDDDVLVVGLIRDPLAVLSSWIAAPKEFKTTWNIQSEWRWAPSKNESRPEEFYGFEKWKEVASMFLGLEKEHAERFLLMRYQSLLDATHTTVEQLFHFLGITWQDQTDRFLVQSRSQHHADAYSVYKHKRHDENWSKNLPDEIARQVRSELEGTELQQFCN